ncbi:efflux RND transporter periplasmic adaptor subunit [Craurococcus roseus]|uniref:Efflux RND transporter periplasmic adaptor subunit n=1 Tax=Craurococcus roseus TaxID=77585 RepID=A0ABN1EJY4_9PROT
MRPVQHLALAALASAALAGCKAEGTPTPQAEAPKPVQVAEVRLAPAGAAQAYTGFVRARREADIGFRVGGRIAARLVEVGGRVTAGQELARLDPADLALSVRAAEADLSAAEAQSRQAAADAARSRTLLAAGHVSAAFDDQRVAAARSAAERAASARAQLDLAKRRLDYAVLRAPTDGVVTALLAEAGQVVAEGQAVLRVANPEERELVVQVPEAAMAEAAGGRAEAAFWARPNEVLPARLRELAPQAETALRTYTARFSLPGAPDWVALGMTGTVRLAAADGGGEAAATLPLSALHDRGRGPMVWRVEGAKVSAVPVEVVSLGEVTATLRGPLADGDRVVAVGPQVLDPDSRVRVAGTRLSATLR